MNKTILQSINNDFQLQYGEKPELLVCAPGRINLVGEHTDYNEGFVFPAAIQLGNYFAIGKSQNQTKSSLFSSKSREKFDFGLDDLKPFEQGRWENYILGVVNGLQKQGSELKGFNLVIDGDIPPGAGLSSSAALECGAGYAIDQLFGLHTDKMTLAKIGQQAEHNFVGVKCGIMDQFASVFGKKDQAMLLDCKSMDFDYFPFSKDSEYNLLICNSNVSHSLASSEYNKRREECEAGVKTMQEINPEINSLRDFELETLKSYQENFDPLVYKRCLYVVEENLRVQQFGDFLKKSEIESAGEILNKAQKGMENLYEITCSEIDFMAGFARKKDYIAGSRMMGGGFGGCTINLIKKGFEQAFVTELNQQYQQKFNLSITPIEVQLSNGVHVVPDTGW
jgi:galactokinase